MVCSPIFIDIVLRQVLVFGPRIGVHKVYRIGVHRHILPPSIHRRNIKN